MRASDIAGMCLQNLKRRRARTVLTSLGVLVATCSIVIMVSIGLGLSEQMSQTLAQMGDLSIIQVNAPYAYSSSDDGIKLNDEAVAQMAPSKRSTSRRTRHCAPVRHARQSDAVLPPRHPSKGQQRSNQPKQVPENESLRYASAAVPHPHATHGQPKVPWYHLPLSHAHIGIKGKEACVGRIWNKTPAWLSGIEADLTLVAGFASFLAVVDFLFWGGAVSSIARPYTSLDIFTFFTIPCFLVAGATLLGLVLSHRFILAAKDATGIVALVEAVGIVGGTCVLTNLLTSETACAPLLALTAAVLGLGLAAGFFGWGCTLKTLPLGRLVGTVGCACVLFPLAGLTLAFSPTLSKYLIAGVLTCCSVTLRRTGMHTLPIGGSATRDSGNTEDADTFQVASSQGKAPGAARAAWRAYGITALSFASLGFVAGLSRMVALSNGANNLAVMLGSPLFTLVAGIVMLGLWQKHGKIVTPMGFYQAAFPFAASGFVVFSIAGLGLSTAFACFANFFFEFMLAVITVHSLSTRDTPDTLRLPSYCLALGLALLFACLGTLASLITRDLWVGSLPGLALSVVVCIYVLSMALMLQMREHRKLDPDTIGAQAGNDENLPVQDSASPVERMESAIATWAEGAATTYELTPRETEILPLVVRGLDTPTIAQALGVSDNTVRTHKKSLYRKLDVHSKQELLELMHQAR